MLRDGKGVLQHIQMETHPLKIMSHAGVPSSSLVPLLKKPADSITMRTGGPNGRAYWCYYSYTTRSVDCTRERVVIRVNPAGEGSDQSDQEGYRSTYILNPRDGNAGVAARSH